MITKIIMLSTVLVVLTTDVNAAECKLANTSLATFSSNTNAALSEADFEKVGELTEILNQQSDLLLSAADQCDCDKAYYSVEELTDDVEQAYFADDIDQAKENLKQVKTKLSTIKKQITQCASKIGSSTT